MSEKRRKQPVELLAAAEVASSEDLVLEILKLLPTKSLIKFELVSKQWLGLISGPEFSRAHTRQNPNKSPSGLFFYDALTKSQSIKYLPLINPNTNQKGSMPSLDFIDPKFKVLQSCNGLLLFRSASISSSDPLKLFILNPTTRQSREILQPEEDDAKSFYICCGFAYDPSISLDYKIVYISCSDKRRSYYKIHVYSSKESSWRIVSEGVRRNIPIDFESGTYWYGAIHWASSRGVCFRFDVYSGKLDYFSMPRSDGSFSRYFWQSRDNLQFLKVSRPSAKKFEVSELSKNTWWSKGWYKAYSIYIPRLVSTFPEIATKSSAKEGTVFAFSVVAVVAGAKMLDRELILRIPGKVIAYNYWAKTVKELIDLPGDFTEPMESSFASSYEFIETLAPV